MIERLIPVASTYAADIDSVFNLVFILVGFWFIVTQGIFLWLIVRFRKRDGVPSEYITGELKTEKRWISIPHLLVLVCDIFLIVAAVKVWYNVKQALPPAQETVRVVAQQWAWSFEHPGADGELGTADDIKTVDELHVEVNKLYHFELVSRDVIHSFSVPVFRLKQDAIPGRTIVGWFQATQTGTFDIQCVEICGVGHALMPGRIVIESPEQHAAWVAQHSPVTLAAASPRAEE